MHISNSLAQQWSDDLGLLFSHRTWVPYRYWVNREYFYVKKKSILEANVRPSVLQPNVDPYWLMQQDDEQAQQQSYNISEKEKNGCVTMAQSKSRPQPDWYAVMGLQESCALAVQFKSILFI